MLTIIVCYFKVNIWRRCDSRPQWHTWSGIRNDPTEQCLSDVPLWTAVNPVSCFNLCIAYVVLKRFSIFYVLFNEHLDQSWSMSEEAYIGWRSSLIRVKTLRFHEIAASCFALMSVFLLWILVDCSNCPELAHPILRGRNQPYNDRV